MFRADTREPLGGRSRPGTRHRGRRRGDAAGAQTARRKAATSATVTAPPASSASWPPVSRCSSVSSSSSRSPRTTNRGQAPRPRRRSWRSSCRRLSSCPAATAAELTGELICYARSVAGAEWDAVNAGTLGDSVNPWGVEMFRTISTVEPRYGDRAVGVRPLDGSDHRTGSRRASTGSTAPRASSRRRCGWYCSSSRR